MNNSTIIKKEEHVSFLKSKFAAYDATLTMYPMRLSLEAEDSNIFTRGIISFLPFLRNKLQKMKLVFDLDISSIKSIQQGQQGLSKNNNVLEITDKNDTTYRVMVKDYAEWKNVINSVR
jgi:hypothetical protein